MENRILIAEDEPKLREVLCDYFRSKGDAPFEAADGLQALELAETEEFDAILLDIMMPGLDGFAVCRAVRRRKDTPILFLTALSDEEDKLYGYELGADDYITKPYSLSVLYAKTTALIRRSRGALRTEGRLESGSVGAIYRRQCELDPKFIRIDCSDEYGEMLPPGAIFAKIQNVVEATIK